MLAAIKHNLTHLLDFGGRDARPTFWYYVLFLFLLNLLGGLLLTIPTIVEATSVAMDAAQSGDQAAVNSAMAASMSGMTATVVWGSVAMGAANVLLLAAAFVRRLHDAGFAGWWALLAVAAQAYALAQAVMRIDEAEALARAAIENSMTTQEVFASGGGARLESLIGWVPTLLVIGFGILKSTPGANRFGEEPA